MSQPSNTSSKSQHKVLFVVTSHNTLGKDIPTGVWFEEFAIPYTKLSLEGIPITVASPLGGAWPIDPKSTPNKEQQQQWQDALRATVTSERLVDVNPDEFDAIFLPGGHGPMYDLAEDQTLKKILTGFDAKNKIIAAVCHGPAGFLYAKNANGDFLIKGKNLTAFTLREEQLTKVDKYIPYVLEESLGAQGAQFICGLPNDSHVVVDGKWITGQNPNSSAEVAQTLLKMLREGEHSKR